MRKRLSFSLLITLVLMFMSLGCGTNDMYQVQVPAFQVGQTLNIGSNIPDIPASSIFDLDFHPLFSIPILTSAQDSSAQQVYNVWLEQSTDNRTPPSNAIFKERHFFVKKGLNHPLLKIIGKTNRVNWGHSYVQYTVDIFFPDADTEEIFANSY